MQDIEQKRKRLLVPFMKLTNLSCSFSLIVLHCSICSSLAVSSRATSAFLFRPDVSANENARHTNSPAIPTIKKNSHHFFNFLREYSLETRSLALSGINRFSAQSDSPQRDASTNNVNAISNQPQAGIEDKKDIGIWVAAICLWATSAALLLAAFLRLRERD